MGAIQRRKNQIAALEAATAVGVPLVVVGPEKDPDVAADLRRRGARLEGYVTTARLAELYRGAICLVQSSRYEGFGLPVLEAMVQGAAVVTSATTSTAEVAGDAGLLVDPSDVRSIRDALAAVLGNPDSAQALRAAGRERAAGFSWARTAGATRDVLRGLAA